MPSQRRAPARMEELRRFSFEETGARAVAGVLRIQMGARARGEGARARRASAS